LIAILFGIISQKSNNKNVITHVEIHTAVASVNHIPEFLAIEIAIVVASDAVNVFTKLFQISIVISNLSLSSLTFLSDLAQNLPSLTSESILCVASDISASSVQEKNADKENKTTKSNMSKGSILSN